MWGSVDTSNDARVRELRRCAKCTAPAVTVVHVTQHYSRGVPSGRTYQHRCGSCNVTFSSISVWRAVVQLFGAAVLVSIGFGMVGLFIATLFEQGMNLFQYADGRMWGTWAVGALVFFGGLAWASWTTWLVARLMLLHPVAGPRP
jgi:hypothetical protein